MLSTKASALLLVLPATYGLSLVAWHVLRRVLIAKHIGSANLIRLKSGREEDEKIPGTAVICGGSIAGLLAARVCREHFERVVIVEAEPWLATDEALRVDGWKLLRQPRARLMQWNSLHSSQPFFFAGLQNLFPNIGEECERSKIPVRHWNPRYATSGALWRLPTYAYKKTGLPKTMFTSRHGLETFLRRLVLDKDAYPNMEILTGTVTDVLPDEADPSRLSKVVYRTEAGATEEISAALVADCTGPTRAGVKWLGRHGYGTAPSYPGDTLPLDQLKISLDQKLHYSSITYSLTQEQMDRLPLPADMKDDRPILTNLEDVTEASVASGRGYLVIWRKDENQIVAFTGHTGSVRFLASTVDHLREYALSMHSPQPYPDWLWGVLDVLEEAQDTAVVSQLKVPPTTYIRYARGTNLPSNFVALGDSVMTVNPIFGEGCTKAMRCVLALHIELLRAQKTSGRVLPSTFAKDFFAEERDKTEWLWDNTRVADYGAPTTEPISGESLSEGAGLRWYIMWLQRLAPFDDHAGLAMYSAVTGFASPIDALHPNLVAKILWHGLVLGK
ncbi:hypothetical protein MKEN_01124400 [Mycena kentingensis (nom. inval.)]|nr:hypothetical protein MKEN_01124400 [Mycena kentingensis (nom. inval.)]